MKKCKECGCNTRNSTDTGLCWNCERIVEMLKIFEYSMSVHQPIIGKPRKLEIIKYKISRYENNN